MENKLLSEIKKEFGLTYEGIILESVILYESRRLINIDFVAKRVFTTEEKQELEQFVEKLFPKAYTLEFSYSKRYCDNEIARREIKDFIKNNYPSVTTYVKSIESFCNEGCFSIKLQVQDIVSDYAISNRMKDEIKKHLVEKFCSSFIVEVDFVETDEIIIPDKLPDIIKPDEVNETSLKRIIEVESVELFIGKEIVGSAKYINDYITAESQDLNLCGTISGFTKRTSKNGKDFFNFTLSDFTGKIYCLVFPSKANVEKVETLTDGMQIIANGVCEFDKYKNANSFIIKNISICQLPKDFVVIEKPSLPVPAQYNIVFPRPIQITSQVDLFNENKSLIPNILKEKTYVVFDIESTGLNFDLDKITEIGAVKIVNGVIRETFSTLINPQVQIRAETIALNGIDNELVKNSPLVKDVLPDFFKFCDGSEIVAHNIDFDIKFIKYNADKIGYYFYHTQHDTLKIARKNIKGLSNYKLDTLCEHFSIELKDHHRAWHDALATAHLFIELMKVADNMQDFDNSFDKPDIA